MEQESWNHPCSPVEPFCLLFQMMSTFPLFDGTPARFESDFVRKSTAKEVRAALSNLHIDEEHPYPVKIADKRRIKLKKEQGSKGAIQKMRSKKGEGDKNERK